MQICLIRSTRCLTARRRVDSTVRSYVLRNKGTVNSRYDRLVEAIKYVSADLPDTINILLKSMEEEAK